MNFLAVPGTGLSRLFRATLHLLSLWPLAWLVAGAYAGTLGDSPARTLLWETGDWSLIFLCITLAVTPLRRLSGWNWLATFRRLPGMYAFFYGLLHFAVYLWMRRAADWLELVQGILTSKAMLTGLVALLIMALLAATSTHVAFRRLGVKGWQNLHRLTYLGAVLAVVHYWLLAGRYSSTRPLQFAWIVGGLLLFRLLWAGFERWRRRSPVG